MKNEHHNEVEVLPENHDQAKCPFAMCISQGNSIDQPETGRRISNAEAMQGIEYIQTPMDEVLRDQ